MAQEVGEIASPPGTAGLSMTLMPDDLQPSTPSPAPSPGSSTPDTTLVGGGPAQTRVDGPPATNGSGASATPPDPEAAATDPRIRCEPHHAARSLAAGAPGRVRPAESSLALRIGSEGQGVTDLRQRLARLGYGSEPDEPGHYGPGTAAAVSSFQHARGLRVDAVCGHYTWSSLVEAGFGLGDRILYLRTPMLHGDDVGALQHRLSALGFDPGGVDGMFGEQTAKAVAAFQHNTGITSDGICGPRTLAELRRLSLRAGGEDLVTAVRERLRVGSGPRALEGRTVVVGEPGGVQVGVSALVRSLAAIGAKAVPVHHPDESAHAEAANTVDACCYVGLRLEPESAAVRTMYYRGYRYESETSKRLAELIASRTAASLGLLDGGTEGMALPVLRQTRMPAVVIELGRPPIITVGAPRLAASVVGALVDWTMEGWNRGQG